MEGKKEQQQYQEQKERSGYGSVEQLARVVDGAQ